MRRPAVRRATIVTATACLAALGLASFFLRQSSSSVERGNRLYREGRVEGAATIYRDRVDGGSDLGASAYNLGTALMALGSSEAEEYLRLAAEETDSAAAQRGSYNLGRLLLGLATEAESPDMAVRLLSGAVASGRVALRLDPGDQDARWNVFLAQRMLDSLSQEVEVAESPADDRGSERSEGGLVIPEPAQLGTPRGLEREALAGDDPGSLNTAEALALLDVVSNDVEALIRGMLWSLRPDVDPWTQPYPGGDW